ncbi:MAG: hypothetical protein DI539_06675 [Flavobacterium psychrophilum]|nr:MAG: hypothetical protein DI539_06675 [Flavobacterium psychrophilum]
MKSKLLYVLLFLSVAAFSQERQKMLGRVVVGDNGVGDVFVINKTAGEEVKTDYKGYFDLQAKPGDRLVVYSTKIVVREFMLNAESFKTSPYVISVNFNSYELEEVVINKYSHINSEALGIVPKGQKRYTVAERRLYCASAMTIGTVIGIDPIINAISGRTKMLKRAYATEKQETTISNARGLYSEEELTANYNIPKEQVNGFLFYLAENEEFAVAVKGKNKSYIDFMVAELAKKYLRLQQEDK